jgi:hypothetical protein
VRYEEINFRVGRWGDSSAGVERTRMAKNKMKRSLSETESMVIVFLYS